MFVEQFLDSGSSRCNRSCCYNRRQFLEFLIIFNILQQLHRGNCVEIGLELDKPELGKGLREDICDLVLGGDVSDFKFAGVDVFSNEMEIYLDVIHWSMEYWISYKVSCSNIVPPECWSFRDL